MFTCSNLRNKKCTLKVENKTFVINGENVNVVNSWLLECSLKREHATFILKLDKPYLKKTELFLDYSWLQHNKKLPDAERVEKVNHLCKELLDQTSFPNVIDEKISFEGRFESTYDMCNIYKCDHFLIAPKVKKMFDMRQASAFFFERMASYLRNFDLTVCFGGTETVSIYTINRKLYYKSVKTLFNSFQMVAQFEGGPDPLPWPVMKKDKAKNKLTWQQISQLYIGGRGRGRRR